MEFELKDKFIGFVDILGFENLVERAEAGEGMSLAEINEALTYLGSEDDQVAIKKYGPTICPNSRRHSEDVDFQVTQVSDCVVVSTEVSPAGAITLINHCWVAVFKLLRCGLMCRGHIRRGNIVHEGQRFVGTGYQEAIRREKDVTAFRRHENDRGTPFVEVDASVVKYIHAADDSCINQVFPRFVAESNGVFALFPFRRLTDVFDIGGDFGADTKKKEINFIRSAIGKLRAGLRLYVDNGNARAMRKLEHYEQCLEDQLRLCDQLDEMIDKLNTPFPGRHR